MTEKKGKKIKRKRIRKTALAFFDAKMINNHDGLQAQIYLHPEKFFSLAFMGNHFLFPLQMGSYLASVYRALYSIIIHVSLHFTLFYLL